MIAHLRAHWRPLVALVGALVAVIALGCCCTTRDAKEPGLLDRAADVAVPAAKGYVCSQETPPAWLPEHAAVTVGWAALRALLCVNPAKIDTAVVDGGGA